MSNQNSSQPKAPLNGHSFDEKPLEKVFNQLMEINAQAGMAPPPYLLDLIKYAYYQGATCSYNMLIGAMREDHSLHKMTALSSKMEKEINGYFSVAAAMVEAKTKTPQ